MTNVVIATGFEQHPRIPAFAAGIPATVTQMHSSRYRNPESLLQGAVLVVGSAQSGAQIAEELYQQARRLPQRRRRGTSSSPLPRQGRGRVVVSDRLLQHHAGQAACSQRAFCPPHVSGTKGGHTLNLHQFAREGVTLLGHLHGASDDTISRARPARDAGEGRSVRARGAEDDRRLRAGNQLDAPEEELPQLRDGYEQPIIEELDLKATGITTIIWATGYNYDYGLVKMPIFDGDGFPIQTRGVTNHDGLYFVGCPDAITEDRHPGRCGRMRRAHRLPHCRGRYQSSRRGDAGKGHPTVETAAV